MRSAAISDRDLVARVRADQGWAFGELAHRYSGLIHTIVSRYWLTGGDERDLRQEALIGLLRACRNYEDSPSRSFKPFAALCIERAVISALKADGRNKHTPLNDAIRLEQPADDDETTFGELVAGPADIAATAIHREQLRILARHLPPVLGEIEATVLTRKLNGATLAEAGHGFGPPSTAAKTADNAMQRVRQKARHLLDTEAA